MDFPFMSDDKQITKMLPGRTDNAVKNRFHATCRQQSRKDYGDDDKMGSISAISEGHTDSDSVEGESLQAIRSVPRPTPRTERTLDPKFNRHADLFKEEFPVGSPVDLLSTNKTEHLRDEKPVRAEKKKKKVAVSGTFGRLPEPQVPQDTASLNEHYIAKLNEYFSTTSTATPVVVAANPMFLSSDSLDRLGSKKVLHEAHRPQQPIQPIAFNQALKPILKSHYAEVGIKRAKCSVSVPGAAIHPFPMRPSIGPGSAGQGQSQIPLGMPHIPRGAVQTTGKLHGVAFHELSLKDRLAPAQSFSPSYCDDFKMNMNISTGSDLELDEFIFDDWINEESFILDAENDTVPCCTSGYEWASSECSNLKSSVGAGCFSALHGGIRSHVTDSDIDLKYLSYEFQVSPSESSSSLALSQSAPVTPPSHNFLSNLKLGGRFCGPSKTDLSF